MKNVIVYKVLTSEGRSATTGHMSSVGKQYKLGEWVYRDKTLGPLTAFKSRDLAEKFVLYELDKKPQKYTPIISEAEAALSDDVPETRFVVMEEEQIISFWKRVKKDLNCAPWPKGTVFCDGIKLLE